MITVTFKSIFRIEVSSCPVQVDVSRAVAANNLDKSDCLETKVTIDGAHMHSDAAGTGEGDTEVTVDGAHMHSDATGPGERHTEVIVDGADGHSHAAVTGEGDTEVIVDGAHVHRDAAPKGEGDNGVNFYKKMFVTLFEELCVDGGAEEKNCSSDNICASSSSGGLQISKEGKEGAASKYRNVSRVIY